MEPKQDVSPPVSFMWLVDQRGNRASRLLALTTALSYTCWTAALIVAIISSHRLKTSMPMGAVISMLSISFICGWFRVADRTRAGRQATWMWRLWSFLLLYLFVRLLQYPQETPWGNPLQIVGAVFIGLFVVGATQWTFMLFFEDLYANITWPFLGVLPMSLSYLAVLAFPCDMKQVSLVTAWLILLAMILQFTAIFLRGLHLFYPHHLNLAFPAWIFVLSMLTLFVYVVTATKGAMPTIPCPDPPTVCTEPTPCPPPPVDGPG